MKIGVLVEISTFILKVIGRKPLVMYFEIFNCWEGQISET